MKRTLFNLLTIFTVSTLLFVSCKNDDDPTDGGEFVVLDNDVPDEVANLEYAAQSIIRGLCSIDELDDDWQSRTYECDEGVVEDDSEPKSRSIVSRGLDDALEYFFDLVPQDDGCLSETQDGYLYDMPGLGSLTFHKVEGDTRLYAFIDVALPNVPNVTKLSFKPMAVINGLQSYSGPTYYHAGDIIKRNSDGTTWICVRPAAGPLRKDKSYWICLDPYVRADNPKQGDCIIKQTTKKYTMEFIDALEDKRTARVQSTETWIYAKNLMTLKTAKAAFFTLTTIAHKHNYDKEAYHGAEILYNRLAEMGYDLFAITRFFSSDDMVEPSIEQKNGIACYCIAYGSPKNDSKRKNSGSRANCQVRYVQPFIMGINADGGLDVPEGMVPNEVQTKYNEEFAGAPYLYGVADFFDTRFIETTEINPTGEIGREYWVYDFHKFLHRVRSKDGNLLLRFDTDMWGYHNSNRYHVIFSPELCIKDNRNGEKPSTSFTDVYVQSQMAAEEDWFDYWRAEEITYRYVDGKHVEWSSEDK